MNATKTSRLSSVDLLRGVVMVLMALDHVRDFVAPSEAPEFMADPGLPLFLTRWVTHFCAPVFVFLAGISAFLYGAKRSTAELSRFLLTRGLWLIVLEWTVVGFAWTFMVPFRFVILQVIWAIGVAMVVLSGLVRLPRGLVAALGIAAVAGHNLLDGLAIEAALLGSADGLAVPSAEAAYALLHVPFKLLFGFGATWMSVYPLVPWVFVLALGWCFGPVLTRPPSERARACLRLGAALTIGFVLLRFASGYGDPRPFESGDGATATAIAFLNTTKYPPSLQFLLMTLGPALLFLGLADRRRGPAARFLTTFGRVPLFYYVLHIALANLAGAAWLRWTTGADRWVGGVLQAPPDGPVELVPVYVAWGAIVLILFPLCRWYDGVKRRGTSPVWSYL